MTILHSEKFGKFEVHNDRDDWITIFGSTADHLYQFYTPGWKTPEDPEPDWVPVKWSNFLLGRRSFRFDMEVPGWKDKTRGEQLTILVDEVQRMYDEDDFFGFHVEPVDYPLRDYTVYSVDDLFKASDKAMDEVIRLERELEHARRNLRAVGQEIGKRDIDW